MSTGTECTYITQTFCDQKVQTKPFPPWPSVNMHQKSHQYVIQKSFLMILPWNITLINYYGGDQGWTLHVLPKSSIFFLLHMQIKRPPSPLSHHFTLYWYVCIGRPPNAHSLPSPPPNLLFQCMHLEGFLMRILFPPLALTVYTFGGFPVLCIFFVMPCIIGCNH